MQARFDRGTVMAAALLLVTLLLGVVGGVALERWALRPQRVGAAPGVMQLPAPRNRFDPARARIQLSARLARQLDLAPEQRVQVDSLLRLQQQEAGALMRGMRPRLDSVTARTQAALTQILTPEQQRKFDALRRRRLR